MAGDGIECDDNMNGRYDVSYRLPKAGRYSVWVTLAGVHIQDSPFQP